MNKKFMLSFIFMVFVLNGFYFPANSYAEVKGDIYSWQMKDYDWIAREFPDVIEKNMQSKDGVKGKSADEIYQWQLRDNTWTTREFDMEPSK